ncbi:MAG: glycosyltransferase family 39 protein [Rhodobacteraceae bacterium]|nr:glycosyltransferase family 39 protein [Paracoccaceae bacterium]
MMISNGGGAPGSRVWLLVALAAVVIGAALRLNGLGVGSLSHPEIYIPGIPLPQGISEPPPRLTFHDTLLWHFQDEPHPMGYYLAMFGWTRLFGTTEAALRLPGALLGTASIWLIYCIGARVWIPAVGALAAAMLALHGFHVQWSQNARMYVPAAFFALLATWFLIAVADGSRRRRWHEVGYVLSLGAGLHTTELTWALVGMHLAWPVLAAQRDPAALGTPLSARRLWQGYRVSQLQGMAVALGAIELAHGLYRARHGAGAPPTTGFLRDFMGFGFLFTKDEFSLPARAPSTILVVLAVAATLLLGLAALRTPVRAPAALSDRPVAGWIRIAVALACSAVVLWLASIAYHRNLPMAAVALLPVLALAIPGTALVAVRLLAPVSILRRVDPFTGFFLLCGFVAPLVIFVASVKVELLAARAFILFVPFVLLLSAAGVGGLLPRVRGFAAGAVALVALFVAGAVYNAPMPNSPNDYKGLAEKLRAELQPDDLIFLRHRNWADTPLLYYLPDATYVTENWEEVSKTSTARIWLITWPLPNYTLPAGDRDVALEGRFCSHEVTARRARAQLYLPPQ